MQLRSLALLVLIFGASAALAGYVGMMYGEQTPERAVQSAGPTIEREVQSTDQPLASPPFAVRHDASLSKPAAPIVPTTETAQTPSLGSTSASRLNNTQGVERSTNDARKPTGSTVVEAQRTTASNAVQGPKCHIQACENAYRSFDASDCTYQPANGPRRACRK